MPEKNSKLRRWGKRLCVLRRMREDALEESSKELDDILTKHGAVFAMTSASVWLKHIDEDIDRTREAIKNARR